MEIVWAGSPVLTAGISRPRSSPVPFGRPNRQGRAEPRKFLCD